MLYSFRKEMNLCEKRYKSIGVSITMMRWKTNSIVYVLRLITWIVVLIKGEETMKNVIISKQKIWDFFYEPCMVLIEKLTFVRKYNKFLRYIVYALFTPYIIIKCPLCILYENTIGRLIMSMIIKNDNKKSFDFEIGFVAILKNETMYIREWLAYHYLLCDKKTVFYLYDNDSTDNLQEVIRDYIDKGIVILTTISGREQQCHAYEDAVRKYKNKCRYMAFIDIDEYITIRDKKETANFQQFIKKLITLKGNAAGLSVNWAVYGSNGQKKKTEGMVIERFIKRGKEHRIRNRVIKTIGNPRLIKEINSPHFPVYYKGAWNVDSEGKRQRLWYNEKVNYNTISLNHYYCKSEEEFRFIKASRGIASSKGTYEMNGFYEHDYNDITDDIMLKYVEVIKESGLLKSV